VRSLVADLGDAYCEALRRLAIGPFAVDAADGETVVPLDAALAFLPARRLADDEARAARHGRRIPAGPEPIAGPVRLLDADGLIAIADEQDGELAPVVGFRG
jgi:tRNA pseudouridine55 synthase